MIFRSGGYFERIYGIGKEKFQACLLSFQCSMEPRQCICERDSSPSPAHALGRSSMGNGLHARIHCADRWESVSDLFPDPSENVPELPFALRWSLPASGCVSVCGCSDLLVFPGKCRIFCVSVPDFMVHEQYLRKSGVRDSSRVGEVPVSQKKFGPFFRAERTMASYGGSLRLFSVRHFDQFVPGDLFRQRISSGVSLAYLPRISFLCRDLFGRQCLVLAEAPKSECGNRCRTGSERNWRAECRRASGGLFREGMSVLPFCWEVVEPAERSGLPMGLIVWNSVRVFYAGRTADPE